LISADELCARLKVPKSWIYNKMRHPGKYPIPYIRMGKYLRFDWTKVAEWLGTLEKEVA
jgi:hypothetical protein